MRIFRMTPNESGAYLAIQDNYPGATPPSWYIQVASGVELTCGGFGTPTIENGIMTAWTGDETAWAAWKAANGPGLDSIKSDRIAYSKTALAAHLASHPLSWTDGKQYSVTEDKQAMLTSNLAAYQLAVTLGQENPELTWNATGEECTVWTFENLAALAIAIKAYVKPLVAYQQAAEVAINACTDADAVAAVTIDYGSVDNA